MPVAEFLPRDRVRLEVEVVDTEGLAFADDQLDSIWLLLGDSEQDKHISLASPRLDVRCGELLLWTMDKPCRLGEGRSSIEFEAPMLGESELGLSHSLWVYTVIAWNGQRAEDCWAARRAGDGVPSGCGFLRSAMAVGPIWWLHAEAAAKGLPTPLPIERFPAAVFLQQANRPPALDHVLVARADTETTLIPSAGVVGPIAVAPGEVVSLTVVVDPSTQFSQFYFVPINEDGDLFTLQPELILTRVSTTGPIRFPRDSSVPEHEPIEIEIDQDAAPGLARVMLVIHDARGAETLVRVELEIQ
jgi:hypothetical protein